MPRPALADAIAATPCHRQGRGHRQGLALVLYNIEERRAVGDFTATGPPQRNIAKGAFGGRFDLHVAFFDGPYRRSSDASVGVR